ncbi:MAG: UbiA prenyltransferase family protein [Phycisphaerae bacterium]|nr:UbiA prenyltransferase family protein [Phycisphaerae bacterium]
MTDSSGNASGGPPGLLAVGEALRPGHWIKNAFVLAAVVFSGRFDERLAWGVALAAAAAFCLLSSGTYLINDVIDRRRDAMHPIKRMRPVASGRLSVGAALVAGGVCYLGGLGLAGALTVRTVAMDLPLGGMGLLFWSGCYVVLSVLYSLWLKAHAIVDVIVIALGFVLRAMAGASAIAAPISPWLVVCTFTLCLFIALTKRRSELATGTVAEASSARPAHRGYTRDDIEHMLTVATALAILTYSLYCLAPRTVVRLGSAHLIWTIPLVVYGLFRYNRVTRRTSAEPVTVLLADRVMWAVVAMYVVIAASVIRYGSLPAVRDVLDIRP